MNNELIFPSPKTGKQGRSVIKAMISATARAEIGRVTIRGFRRTFGTRLNELNYSSSVTAKLLGHGDGRSVHRYQRRTKILRERFCTWKTQILPEPEKKKHLRA